jgi:hypothetical protein
MVSVDADKNNPFVQALALLFDGATQKETQARFELFARLAQRKTKGQTALVPIKDGTPAQAFATAFLKPLAVVDGEVFPGFDPAGNELHAALQYAHDNGGRGHSVSAALEKAHKGKGGKDMARLLGKYSGAVNIYEPHTGNYLDAGALAALDDLALVHSPEAQERLRNELLGQDRVNAGRLVDAVLRDIGNDAPLDVMGHARKLGMEDPPYLPDGRSPGGESPQADWTPEPAERQAMPPTPEERALADRALDAEAARLVSEGAATPEEAALLERHAADMEAVNREEDAALSVLECIVNTTE